jgi:heat shock protein HslJ
MFRKSSIVRLRACLFVAIVLTVLPALAQRTTGDDAVWLDRPLTNWNQGTTSIPSAPPRGSNLIAGGRCRESVRPADSIPDRALMGRGWVPYGRVQSFGPTTVITAMSGVDGMCRPMGYQAFVFRNGRFAGTLSPRPMGSREDGSLTDVNLLSPTSIAADFNHYSSSDALCCPSRHSTVVYEIGKAKNAFVSPKEVTTEANCLPAQASGGGGEGNVPSGPGIFGRRWRLSTIKGVAVAGGDAYIEFDQANKRFTGNTGCNRMSGQFELSGNQIKPSRVISTKMACLDSGKMQVESDFTRALESVTRFELDNNNLRLFADGQEVLTFVSQ